MCGCMSKKIISQCKASATNGTTIWPRMGFAMAAVLDAVSLRDAFDESGTTYLCFP